MSESTERSRAGEERAGKPCGWCQAPLDADQEAAVCVECAALHHGSCWDRELGCSGAACLNAPLKRLDAPPPGSASREAALRGDDPGAPPEPKRKKPKKRTSRACVGCGEELPPGTEVCDGCLAINTPDGLYHGPKKTSPLAREALIMALVGIFICQPILGGLAIQKSNAAREAIRRDPRLGGEGLATAALVIGILDLCLFGLGLFSRVGGIR
jgi:hypothetical protein